MFLTFKALQAMYVCIYVFIKKSKEAPFLSETAPEKGYCIFVLVRESYFLAACFQPYEKTSCELLFFVHQSQESAHGCN